MRRLVAVGAAVLVLVGCAADEDASTSSSVAASAEASASATSTAAAGARTITHEKGSTEVPADPQRVVVLDSSILDFALFLGVTPIGAARTDVDTGLPDYLGERAEGIEVVGELANPNLEAIAALDPDLIITSVLRDDERADRLNAIAPTVYTQGAGNAWRTDLELTGEALGRADDARDALADFDARAEQIGESIGAEGKTASVVRFLADETRVYGPDSFSGSVLRTIGFGAPELDYDEFAIAYISPEQIETADADVLFTTAYGPADETSRASVSAVWGSLGAIESGCQFDVDDDTWMVGIGLIGAESILDDVERLLIDADCGD